MIGQEINAGVCSRTEMEESTVGGVVGGWGCGMGVKFVLSTAVVGMDVKLYFLDIFPRKYGSAKQLILINMNMRETLAP